MTTIYTLLLYLVQPLIWLRLWLRGRKAPAYRKRWAERYGFCAGKVQAEGIVLHSVSVGETLAAVPLVRALRHRYPTLPITVTTMTPTGSERAQSAFGKDVHHVYLPYDLPDAIHRFLNTANPRLMIIMETELWPNIINILHQRQIPLVIANARLSERSAKGYKKIGGIMRRLLNQISLIAAQNEEDGERFIALGLRRSHLAVTGSLKFDISVTPELAARAITLRRQWAPRRPVWIATSTHEGEETIVLDVHRRLLQRFPDLLLILVPRHPERFADAREMTQKLGFSFTLRSSGEIPSGSTQVVVGDTMGELMLLYGIADLAFVGGSLVERGGHNPLEPAAHAIPVLMGPHTWNFKDICARLQQAEGLITVSDALALEKEVTNLLLDDDYRRYYGRHAVDVLHQNQGALQRLVQLLEPYLPPESLIMARQRLSVVMIARDEATLLPDCLASIRWADEIVLLDSGSQDSTRQIARAAGARVEQNCDWQGYGRQRQLAQSYATGDMILMIDADERVTPELRAAIEQVLEQQPAKNTAYSIARRNLFLGRFMRHSGWYPDRVLRLYPRTMSYGDDKVHESLRTADATIKALKGDLLHLTCRDLIAFQRKQLAYAEAWAAQRHQQGRTCGLFSACLHALGALLKTLVLRAGFLDGKQGWLLAIVNAQYTFNKYAALWALNHTSSRGDV